MSTLSADHLEAIRELRVAYPDAAIALIGAAALAFHVEMTWRSTADIDLVLAISFEDLENSISKLQGWRKDPAAEQRWLAPNGVRLDLVPAPPDALARRKLVWPKTKLEMSLAGVSVALQAGTQELAPGVSIAVPAVAVIALLKMAAYLDRPHAREKDLQDLAYILNEYPNDDRLFADDVLELGLYDRQARAFILGQELRVLGDENDRAIVAQFIKTVSSGSDSNRLILNSPWRHLPDPEEHLRQLIGAFQKGFDV